MDFLKHPTFQLFAVNFLRIAAGLLFMQHGAQKLFGLFSPEGREPVELFSLMGLAGVLEFWGGLLIVVGLFTSPVAAVLVLEMIAAYSMSHLPNGFWPILNRGELALLYGSIFLFVAASGGGGFSLDGLFRRRNAGTRRSEAVGLL